MNYFKSFVKGTEDSGPSGTETVARLCDRVSSSTLLEDRRDAVRALKSLSRKFRLEVGSQALPHLIEVLRSDASDEEATAYTLETLYNLTTVDEEDEGDLQIQSELAVSFVDKVVEKSDNVVLVLDMIEKYEFSVRWSAIRLLTSLLRGKSNAVQQIILVKPMGISRVMDLLTENREVIRNDALLVLIELTKGNSNIQKIVAFENGFEAIFSIINEEGLCEGGVVVEDCLLLLLQLLRNNTSNQQFFKEGSLIQRLTPFFDIHAESSWSAQKNANIHLMLKVVRTLVSPSNPSNVTSSCQLAMQHCQLLGKLSSLLMATGVPTDILTETINTVSEVIRGCSENQKYFATVMAPWEPPRPALVVLLMSMVNSQQPFLLRCAVLYCFQCYLHKNMAGQSEIIETLLPSSLDPQDVSIGQLLCGGLFAHSDPLSNWLASTALSHALRSNEEAKLQLLRVQLATAPGSPPVTLLKQITNMVQQTSHLQTRVGLLNLLCGWLSTSPTAVSHFLGDTSAVPFLLSQLSETGNELDFVAQGVCALLLGICIIDNDGSVQQFSKEALIELVDARVGIEHFCDSLSCVSQHNLYTLALQKAQPSAESPDHLLFDHLFAKLFKNLEDVIMKTVSNLDDVKKEEEVKAAIKAHDSIVSQYKTLIREQDENLETLKSQCNKLESELSTASKLLVERDSQVSQLKDQYNLIKLTQASSGDDALATLTQQIETLSKQNEENEKELAEKQQAVDDLSSQVAELKLENMNRGNAIVVNGDVDKQSVRQEVEELKSDAGDAKVNHVDDALIAEKVAMQTHISQLEEKVKSAEACQAKLEEDKEELSQKVTSSNARIKELEDAQAEQASKMEQLSATAESVQKEQEDLLILLSDQEAKLKEYKQKLIGFGAEVSADEDEESDDEGDDDDSPQEDT